VENKGAEASGCNVVPAKVGRRRNGKPLSRGVEERSSRHGIPGGRRHPGFRESVALRGAMSERGPWSNREDDGSIQPFVQRLDDEKGVPEWLERGGAPSPSLSCGSRRREGRSFAQGYLARAIQRCRPTAIAANGGRIEALPASSVAIGRWHSRQYPAASLQRSRGGFEGVVTARSFRDPSSTGEGRRAVKSTARSEGGSEFTAERGTLGFSRETDARECVRASEVQLQKSLGVCLTQRSACRRLA